MDALTTLIIHRGQTTLCPLPVLGLLSLLGQLQDTNDVPAKDEENDSHDGKTADSFHAPMVRQLLLLRQLN